MVQGLLNDWQADLFRKQVNKKDRFKVDPFCLPLLISVFINCDTL